MPCDLAFPLQVIESSVTSPRDPARVAKCVKWFEVGGIIEQLRAAHPGRAVLCVFFYDGKLGESGHARAYQKLDAAAAACGQRGGAPVSCVVIDSEGLSDLGIAA